MHTFFRSCVLTFALCTCVIGWVGSTASAQSGELGKVGVSAGANLQQADDLGTTASFEKAAGYSVGVFYDQPLDGIVNLSIGTFAVRTGAVLRRVGAYEFSTAESDPQINDLLAGTSFNVYAVDVPLDIRYQYDDLGDAAPYVFVGPQLSVLRAEQDFESTLNQIVLSANAGFGAEFEIPAALGLIVAPELLYTLGITEAVDGDITYRFRQISTNGLSFSGFSARVHVYLPF